MSGGAGQSLVRGFCEVFLNSGLTRVGPNNARLDVSILEGLEKTGSLLDSTILTSSNTPLLIVQYCYTQET
jgi:hypothetical protein